jgi:short-subunit dehydrogenase
VTGASAGIGLSLAKLLSIKEAKVVMAARSSDTLKKLEKEIPNSYAITTDMRNVDDVKNLIKETKKKFGRVDILINNAGQGLRSPVENINIDEYRDILELNVIAPVLAMQEVIPMMRAQGGGMILNISSLVSKNYFPELAAYASTKYALNAISLTAREELKKDNIVVSVFHPKMTATDFGKNSKGTPYVSAAGRPGMQADSPEIVAEEIIKQIESEVAEVGMQDAVFKGYSS